MTYKILISLLYYCGKVNKAVNALMVMKGQGLTHAYNYELMTLLFLLYAKKEK